MSTDLYDDRVWLVTRYWGGNDDGLRFAVHHVPTGLHFDIAIAEFRALYDVIAQTMIAHRDTMRKVETVQEPEGGYRGKRLSGLMDMLNWHTETVTVPTCWLVMFEGPYSQQGRPQEHYKIQTDDMQVAVAVAFNLLQGRFVPDRMTISRTEGYSWEVVVPNA